MTPWTVACQTLLSMGFSWQEYWSGLPCLPPRDLPDPEIKLASHVSPALQADSLPIELPGKPTGLFPMTLDIKHSLLLSNYDRALKTQFLTKNIFYSILSLQFPKSTQFLGKQNLK